MKQLPKSRHYEVNLEQCVETVGNRYDLVIAAAQRTRELLRQHRESSRYISCIDTLLEIQGGKFDTLHYLCKVEAQTN